jgi:hypothetical protein
VKRSEEATADRLEPPQRLGASDAAAAMLLAAAIDQVEGLATSLRCRAPILVPVPSKAWVAPLAGALHDLLYQPLARMEDGDDRWRAHGGKVGGAVVFAREGARAVADGKPAIGIAVDPEAHLPSDLLAAAEHSINVPALDAPTLCPGHVADRGSASPTD